MSTKSPQKSVPKKEEKELMKAMAKSGGVADGFNHMRKSLKKQNELFEEHNLELIPVDSILAAKRVRDFRHESVALLKVDISAHGLLHPITVYSKEDKFVLVAGFHRFHAMKELFQENPDQEKYTKIPAKVIDSKYATQIELAENLYRSDLSVLEKVDHLGRYLANSTEQNKESISNVIAEFGKLQKKSDRNLYRYKKISDGLSQDIISKISTIDSKLKASTTQLECLSNLTSAEQASVIEKISQNPKLKVQDVVSMKGEEPTESPMKNVALQVIDGDVKRIKAQAKKSQMKQQAFIQRLLSIALDLYEEGKINFEGPEDVENPKKD